MSEFKETLISWKQPDCDYETIYDKILWFIVEDLELYLNIVKKSQNLERLCVNLIALGSICKEASHTIETELLGDVDA